MTGELVWTEPEQGYVLSAFFWGYFCTQLIGGYLAGRYGGRLVIGFSLLACSLLTLISPLAASVNVFAFVVVQALMGVVQVMFCKFFLFASHFSDRISRIFNFRLQGTIFPAFHTMWSMWAPPLERSLLTGLTYAGKLTLVHSLILSCKFLKFNKKLNSKF